MSDKVLFWLIDAPQTWARLDDVAYIMGGKTIVGALMGGA